MKKIILSLFILFVSASAWAGIGLGHQDWYLTIDAAALDKEFLFMPTLVVDSTLKSKHPTTSYTPKIVYFRFLNGKIFLFEKMDPAKALEPYKPEKILAEFPVVKMREKSFIFDVKSGIEHFLLDGGDDKTVLVHSSYLRDFMETDSLFSFYHVIQSGDDPEKTMILNYAFRVNDKNVDFEIVPPDSKGRVGVFTASEGVAVHWDIRKPVVFHISANTPDAFFEAVKEGILMWNGAFGLNVIRAERAPVDAIIGDPRYNMVQWVDRDWGPAYADLMQYHPLTGEVLHANVFFPSLFAVVGQKDAKQLLEKIQSDPLSFQKRGFCQRDESHSLDEFARMVVEGSISEESVLRLSKRYVRSIVAHEIGHTLGLKHNFKGNLGSAFSLEANAENVKAWLEEDLLDSTLPSSSIMDYQLFEDEIRMHSVGSYDKAAIRYLYQARPLERESLLFPPFCTDTDVGSDVFCLRWDTSSDPLRWEIGKMKNDLESGSIASLGGQMTESLRFFNEKQTGFYSKNGAFLSGIYDLTDLYVKILSENIPSHQGLRVKILETLLQGNPPFSLLKIQGTGDRIITLIVDWISSTTDSKEMRLMAVEALLGLEDGDLKDFGNLVAEQNLWKNILDFQQSLNRAKNAEEKEKLEKSLASEQALLDFLSKPTPVIVTEQSPQ